MSYLCQGRIVWAPAADPNGHNRYARPNIVLTRDDEIESGEIYGVVASHTAANVRPRPDEFIPIPWHPEGRVRTQLRKETVAVCTWVVSIQGDEIESYGGVVPPQTLLRILEMRQQLDK